MGTYTLNLILKRSAWVLMLIGLLTAPAVWTLVRCEFSPSIIESFVDNREDYLEAMELENLFSGNPDALLWLASDEGESLFTQEKLLAIRTVAGKLLQLDEVKRVVSLPDLDRPAQLQRGVRGTMQKMVANAKLKKGVIPAQLPRLLPILPRNNLATPEELLEVKERLLQNSRITQQFLSLDGQSHVMLIELTKPYDIPPFQQAALIHEIVSIAESEGLGQQGLHCTGLVALQAYAYEQIGQVLMTFLPLGGCLISIAVLYIFRRLEVVGVTLFIAAISVCWGISLGLLVYGKFSVLLAAVPLMVLVISTADVIHLVSSYTAEIKKGRSHELALRCTFIEVGRACVLTSITTFVGFASLTLVPSTTIRQFGFSAAAGVASALILSVVLVPVFLNRMARQGRPVTTSGSSSVVTSAISKGCLWLSTRYYVSVIVVFMVALGACGYIASQVSLDPDLTKRFPEKHPITTSTEFFAEQFGGVNSVEILIRGKPGQLLSPETLVDFSRFEQRCRQIPEVSHVTSVASPLGEFLKQLDYRNEDGIPYSEEHATASIGYLEKVAPELIGGFITPDHQQTRILARIQQTSYMEMLKMSEQIQTLAREEFDEQLEVSQKGSAPLVGKAVGEIIRGHMQGFLICFSVIFVLISFGLRSLRLGCLSVLPNLTPLLFLGGLVGWFSDKVDSDILAVATMGLGLAVDDTIHFLSRFKIEYSAGKSLEQALGNAMDHTGLAIIRTTLVLSVGFLPFACSGYWSIQMLGTYLVLVLFSAVLADLLFLPAILFVSCRGVSRSSRSQADGGEV